MAWIDCLSVAEIAGVYEVLRKKYVLMDMKPIILYGRIKAVLGEFPTIEK